MTLHEFKAILKNLEKMEVKLPDGKNIHYFIGCILSFVVSTYVNHKHLRV